MKILFIPIWILSLCLGTFGVFDSVVGDENRKLIWTAGWMLANSIPLVVLFSEYDKETARRKEIEMRWKKELQKQNL